MHFTLMTSKVFPLDRHYCILVVGNAEDLRVIIVIIVNKARPAESSFHSHVNR